MNKLISIVLLILFFTSNADASCLGLTPPAPKTTNLCERLVEKLIIPQYSVFCDLPWYAEVFMPHCKLPMACQVDPVCKSFEVTKKIGEVVLNPGQIYCDFRSIPPEKIILGIRDQIYTDTVKLTTGGTSSILFDIANRHIDILSCNGSQLNEKLKGWINCITAKSTVSQNEYFYPIDVNRAISVSKTNPTASLYLRSEFNAITLDDVVIIEDPIFQIIKNWNKNVGDILTETEKNALKLIIHELVHVRQYREMGKETFINLYLTEAVAKDYATISKELEASKYGSWARTMLDTPNLCATSKPSAPRPACPTGQKCCGSHIGNNCNGQCIPRGRICP